MVLRVTLCIAFLSFNLLTGAESPVSEKLERSSNVEYNKTLKYKTTFLRKPPYLLITSQLIPSHSKSEYKNGFAFSSFINGKKESDYFGFSEFTIHEAYGERTTHKYHTTPYSDFLMNRALAGAEKETRIVGNDNNDYGTILTTSEVRQIQNAPGVVSYLPVTTKIE
ncbi:hypothetical protein LEP1GSC072_0178, partial [Leptospira noguchii str. Bonito]